MSQEESKNIFIKSIEYIPIISGIVIVVGIIRLYFYYLPFGFDVFQYTDIFDFIGSGLIALFPLGFGMLFGFSMPYSPQLSEKMQPKFADNNRVSIKSFKKIMSIVFLLFILIPALIWLIKVLLSDNGFTEQRKLILTAIGFALVALIVCQGLTDTYVEKMPFNKTVFITLFFSPILIIYFSFFSYVDALDVLFNNKTIHNSIVLSDKLISSDSTYFYIGQTKDQVFFHDSKTHLNEIYKQSDISKITLK